VYRPKVQNGDVTTPADETGSDPSGWHRPLHHTPAGRLEASTAQTPGMERREAVSGRLCGSEAIWMGETIVSPSVASADHHHGRSETGIYIVSGHPVFVFLDRDSGEETRIETSPGDYVYVPPWTPHREENPSPDEAAVVVLARSTQEAIVVNLPDLAGGRPTSR
jgi:uncharacterized RmlC-like cupin family protein